MTIFDANARHLTGLSGLHAGGGLYRRNRPVFNPATDVSGLKLWIDAADTAKITASAGLIDSIIDKSGSGNTATGTTTTRPTTGTRTLNGKNVIDFPSGKHLTVTDDADFNHNATGYTAIVVGAFDSAALAAAQVMLSKVGTAGNREWWIGNIDATNGITHAFYTDGTNVKYNEYNQVNDANPGVFYGSYGGAATKPDFGFNRTTPQVTYTSTQTVTESASDIRIGAFTSGLFTLDGYIAEVLYYNRKLTATELDKIMDYLGNKWGLTTSRQDETMIVATAGQSNATNAWSTTGSYNNDGVNAFTATAGAYFSSTQLLRNAESGKPVMQVSSDGNHWVDSDLTDGPYLTQWISQIDGYVVNYGAQGDPTKVKALVFVGGEGDCNQSKADFKAAVDYMFDRFIAQTQPNLKIFVVVPGRLEDVIYAGYQKQRDALLELIAERDDVYFGAEAFGEVMGDTIHYSAAAQAVIWENVSNRIAAVFGKRSEVGTLGPIITSATYSGSTVTATVELDGGSALSGSEVDQFRIEDDGVAATINSLAVSGNTITFTLSGAIAGGSTVKLWTNYDRGANITQANVVRDANGLTLRSVSELSVTAG